MQNIFLDYIPKCCTVASTYVIFGFFSLLSKHIIQTFIFSHIRYPAAFIKFNFFYMLLLFNIINIEGRESNILLFNAAQ